MARLFCLRAKYQSKISQGAKNLKFLRSRKFFKTIFLLFLAKIDKNLSNPVFFQMIKGPAGHKIKLEGRMWPAGRTLAMSGIKGERE